MPVFARSNGKFLRLQPGETAIHADRDGGGPHEELEVTKVDQWYSIKFAASGRQLCLNEQSRDLESRPAGDVWGWGGRWELQKGPSGWYAVCAGVFLSLEGFRMAPRIVLEARGSDFVDEQGQRVVLAGNDAFPALRQFRDGGPAAVQALVDESVSLGFKVWRMWSQGDRGQNNTVTLGPNESGYYESVGAFSKYLNEQGIIPLWTAFVDNQVVRSPIGHWLRLIDAAKDSKCLFSGFNQWSKNKSDFGPSALPTPPAGTIWSRGSDVDDTMTHPHGAPAGELHATRQSFERALMDATASPPTMREPKNGYGMIWMTEGMPFGDPRGYSEHQAWKLGRAYSIEWALAVFHNRSSQFGRLMDEVTYRKAAMFVKGMTL
jgi:hypothetical protein